ncbi:inositol monophosphatase family protein [Streptomyces sp. NPDC052052]|uniref:inositol monophosphatase family protein n=1 Tax=Streptomyces sp. NPDC052052 TaxID=3154756 RepID=UPI00341D633A
MNELPDLHRVAQEAVDAGVEWLTGEGTTTPWTRVRFKSSGEEVTPADVEVERRVTEVLADRTPDIPVIAEESYTEGVLPARCWLLDPIDGTMNFTRGAPGYAVSLAYMEEGSPLLALVHAPALRRRWSTGATPGPAVQRPTGAETLSRAVVGLTGTGRGNPRVARLVGHLYNEAYRIRVQGAMSLDLVGVSEGWLDACVCLRPKPWDVAAGAALVRERGGVVLGAGGRDFTPDSPVLVAGASSLARELVAVWESFS